MRVASVHDPRLNFFPLQRLGLHIAEDLRGSVPHELLKGTGQVRLIEITRLEYRVEDRDAVPQQGCRLDGALILADVTLRLPGRLLEAMPQRARGHLQLLVLQRGIHHGVPHQVVLAHQALDERLNILEIWELPRRALPPESLARRLWQHLFFVQIVFGGEVRQEHTQLELDPQDLSAFAKYEVSGQGAEAFLDGLLANRLPQKVGRLGLAHMLSQNGGVRSEFTVFREGPESFYLVGMGSAERHDWDYLSKARPRDGSVDLQKVTTQVGVLALAGPLARDVLQSVTDADLSTKAFPWLTGRTIDIGPAYARVLRVNFVGELGYELHHPIEMQNTIFDLLMEAGKPFGIRPFGMRAMDSLRLEKSYRILPRELSIEYCALESGLDRFVHPNKGQFVGRDALVRWQQRGFDNRFVTMQMLNATDADARGSEPILLDGRIVGRCTSGGFGFRLAKSLALGMVRPDLGEVGRELDVMILGEKHRAVIVPESPFDPDNARLRA